MDRLHDLRMVVAAIGHRNPGTEIQIGLAGTVGQPGALSFHNLDVVVESYDGGDRVCEPFDEIAHESPVWHDA